MILGSTGCIGGVTEDFEPGSGSLIASLCDTVVFDGGWRWDGGYYYKVSAVDVHGNESGFALLRPEDVTGDEMPGLPEAAFLAQNYPNPFDPTTRIVYGLSRPSRVMLYVHDVSGRLVRVLRRGELSAEASAGGGLGFAS